MTGVISAARPRPPGMPFAILVSDYAALWNGKQWVSQSADLTTRLEFLTNLAVVDSGEWLPDLEQIAKDIARRVSDPHAHQPVLGPVLD